MQDPSTVSGQVSRGIPEERQLYCVSKSERKLFEAGLDSKCIQMKSL